MASHRFSTRGLLAVTAICALAVFLMLHANWWAYALVLNILILVYLSTAVASCISPTRWRAFLIGFTIFGLGYLALSSMQNMRHYLWTNVALQQVYERVAPPPPRAAPLGPSAVYFAPVTTHFIKYARKPWSSVPEWLGPVRQPPRKQAVCMPK